MITKEEKDRGLREEKWERHNLYYSVGSFLMAIFSLSWLIATANVEFWKIVNAWENSTIFNLFLNILPLYLIIFLIHKTTVRMHKIEQIANNWEQANHIGRGIIKWARIMLITAMIFWILSFGIIYYAFNQLSKF